MVWGTTPTRGIEDWIERLQANDPTFTSLQVFRSRKFGLEEVKHLCKALRANTCLTSLSSSGLPASTAIAQEFGNMLEQNKGLQSLGVGDGHLGDEALGKLAGGLQNNSTLESLEMEHKGITSAGAKSLADGLAGSSLKRLQMARNDLGDAGAEALAPCLQQLEEADLSSCGIGSQGAVALAVPVAAPASQLQVLRLGGNALGPAGAQALGPALACSPALADLHLCDTDIQSQGAAAIAKALALAPKLRFLDLSRCGIGADGLAALTDALRQGGALQVLRLRGNPLGEEGASSLAEAVRAGDTLLDLDVGSCEMGPAAAELVACGRQLRKLSLFNNRLGDGGAARVAELATAEALTALLELELSACSIGAPGMQSLFGALQTGVAPALEVLLVAANPATDDPDFQTGTEMLQAIRPELDVAWTTRNGPADASLPAQADGQTVPP